MNHEITMQRLGELPECEAKTQRAAYELRKMAKLFRDENPDCLTEVENICLEMVESGIKPKGVQTFGGALQIRTYAGKGQRTFASLSKNQFALAYLLADCVAWAMWPFRREYSPEGDEWPAQDKLNLPVDTLKRVLEHDLEPGQRSEFAGTINGWCELIREFGKELKWAVAVRNPDGTVTAPKRHTVSNEMLDLRIQFEDTLRVQGEDLANIKAHNEAADKDMANLFSQQHALHEKCESIFEALADLKATQDVLCKGMTQVLSFLVETSITNKSSEWAQRRTDELPEEILTQRLQLYMTPEERQRASGSKFTSDDQPKEVEFKQEVTCGCTESVKCDKYPACCHEEITCFSLPCGCTESKTCTEHSPGFVTPPPAFSGNKEESK